MKWRKLMAACMLSGVLAVSSGARAASSSSDDDEVIHDARTEGYRAKVQTEKNSTALTWIVFLFLSVVGMAALFKDAKRSHLD